MFRPFVKKTFVFITGSILNILTSLQLYSTLYNNYASRVLNHNNDIRYLIADHFAAASLAHVSTT